MFHLNGMIFDLRKLAHLYSPISLQSVIKINYLFNFLIYFGVFKYVLVKRHTATNEKHEH